MTETVSKYILYTRWYAIYRCVDCNKLLSDHERMYSDGVCPYCGFRGENAATIVDTKNGSARRVYEEGYLLWFIPRHKYIKTEYK
jgi:DNA-directed RNA polymerase subunit RPC12/RpoP